MPFDFDQDLRRLHAASLDSVSLQTLARLRSGRHAARPAPRPRRALAWLGATACTALLAMVAATQLMPSRQASPSTVVPASVSLQAADEADAFVSTTDVLDQNPDLYVWLGSDASLAME